MNNNNDGFLINSVESLIQYIKYELEKKNTSVYAFGRDCFSSSQRGYYYLHPKNFPNLTLKKLCKIFDYLEIDYSILGGLYSNKGCYIYKKKE